METNIQDSFCNKNSFLSQKGQIMLNHSGLETGQSTNIIVKLVNSPSNQLDLALKLFESVKNVSKSDEIIYYRAMDTCLRYKEVDKMLIIYDEMLAAKVKPSSITCGIVIKGYGIKGNLSRALEIYEEMKRENFEISYDTYESLMNACIKSDNLERAYEFYKEAIEKVEINTTLMNTLIKAYSKHQNLSKVLEIFNQMKKDKINPPNNTTYNSVLECCVKSKEIKQAEKIFEEMCSSINKPNIFTFYTIIIGLIQIENVERACDYLIKMEKFNVKPNVILLDSLLIGCEMSKQFKKGVEIFTYVRSLGIEPSFMAFSNTIEIMGELGDFDSSKIIFEELKTKKDNIPMFIFTRYMNTCFATGHFYEAVNVL